MRLVPIPCDDNAGTARSVSRTVVAVEGVRDPYPDLSAYRHPGQQEQQERQPGQRVRDSVVVDIGDRAPGVDVAAAGAEEGQQ